MHTLIHYSPILLLFAECFPGPTVLQEKYLQLSKAVLAYTSYAMRSSCSHQHAKYWLLYHRTCREPSLNPCISECEAYLTSAFTSRAC